MAYTTNTGKAYEQVQDALVDSIFYNDNEAERKINIGTLAQIALKTVKPNTPMANIVAKIAQAYTGESQKQPTEKMMLAFRSYLKDYSNREVLNVYQIKNSLPEFEVKTETELLREQITRLQSRVEALERYLFEATLKRQPDPDELPF